MTKILLTNDDGVRAKGMLVLAKSLQQLPGVSVTIVAPLHEQSSQSHAISLNKILRYKKIKKDVYAVEGTPTDCVFMGTWAILKEKPDLIISGINRGGNLGEDIHYSGTVAAAMEGGIMGVPAIAFSQLGKKTFSYDVAATFALSLVKKIQKHPLKPGIVLNVNVPEKANLNKVCVTKIGKRDYGGEYVERKDPRGKSYYWIGGSQYRFVDIKGSDCNAILDGCISVTPLDVDLTSEKTIKTLSKIL
jgi:5'-nucleotidase